MTVDLTGDVGGDIGSGPPPPPPSRFGSLRHELGEDGARGALIAFVATVVFLGVGLFLVLNSSSWPKVQQQFFNPENFRESWPDVLGGFWLDIKMFAIAEVLILAFGLLVAIIRSLRGPAFFPLRLLSIIYIDLFRGIPILLILFLLGFGVPALQLPGVPNDPLFWGVASLVLSYAAYTAEVYRAGIDSVHESQRAAARSLGLTQWQTLRFAIVPQAIRNVIPALLNGLVSLQKDVALVSVLGIREAVREAEIYKSRTFNYTSFVAATVLFLLASVPLARLTDWYTKRERARRSQALV